MRIGEVNRDNYKQFLQLFGIKNSEVLDKLMNKDNKEPAKDTWIGNYVEEGMLVNGDKPDDSRRIVPVSDEVRNKIIVTVRRQILENGNGMTKPGAVDGMEIGAIMKEYRKNIPPSERLAVTWTLSQIHIDEAQRIVDYIKANDPTWTHGQRFDKNILLNSNFGTNSIDTKA
jgi:hypothetical protein